MCYSRNNTLLITNMYTFRYLDTLGSRKFGDCFVGNHINLMSDKPYFAHVTVLELEEKKVIVVHFQQEEQKFRSV